MPSMRESDLLEADVTIVDEESIVSDVATVKVCVSFAIFLSFFFVAY